jgi:tetratricopeptide (TPR) repeat protein
MTMLSLFHRRNPCVHFCSRAHFWTLALTCFIALLVLFAIGNSCTVYAQEPDAIVQQRVAQEIRLVQEVTDQHGTASKVGYLWANLAADYRKTGNFSASESAYFQAIRILEGIPSSNRNYATTLDNFGMLYLSYGRIEEAERYVKRSEQIRKTMNYPLDLARSEQHMAEIDLAKHKFKEAENEAAHALEVMQSENDPEKLDLISALNALAYTRCSRKRCEQGMEAAQRSLELSRSAFGADSKPTAHAMMAVGFALWKLGRVEDADRVMHDAIQIVRSQSGQNKQALQLMLLEYLDFLRYEHRADDVAGAVRELDEARAHATFCSTCVTVNSLRGNSR